MANEYGFFNENLGGYTITKLPKAGLYEYVYKNDELLLKVDQFGLQTAQINPPVGEALVKREKRELGSPIRLYFDYGKGVLDTFSIFKANDLKITFNPEKATYSLVFDNLLVTTEIFTLEKGKRFIFKTTFTNNGEKPLKVRALPCVFPYVNALMMAPWDKPEWYTKTEFLGGAFPTFKTTRYSVNGKKEDRRYFSCAFNQPISSRELSAERLTSITKGFSVIPSDLSSETEDVLYTFEQCFSATTEFTVAPSQNQDITMCFACDEDESKVENTIKESVEYFSKEKTQKALLTIKENYSTLFSKRVVKTPDEDFNRFVNGFLPLELYWVSALDRGWPTGMRGVRDASNDFQGFISYDEKLCREVISNIFSKQRSDGWYPRQIPFGNSDKFDLRQFVDSACFFTEFVYDYLAQTDDYTILNEIFPYYDSDKKDDGLTHLIAGIEYFMKAENIGEHGLVKIRGGDWLDCLSGAGLDGKGETVMVSFQVVMSIEYLTSILTKLGLTVPEKYTNFANSLKTAINTYALNSEGFYNGVYTDGAEWIFSTKDPDGERRVYAPTNAYAIISGVAKNSKAVVKNLLSLRDKHGYRLFNTPFGAKPISKIGKMGTGDFLPYFSENASVYNHGSQAFLLRALAKIGDHEHFEDVLNFAMPIDEERRNPSVSCAPPYAITNCYHLVPSFCGRAGFSFLTGSVAMIERAIYSWMFGVQFTLDEVVINPCLPKRYKDSQIKLNYGDTQINLTYIGYGSKITSATFDGKATPIDKTLTIDKKLFVGKKAVEITVCLTSE